MHKAEKLRVNGSFQQTNRHTISRMGLYTNMHIQGVDTKVVRGQVDALENFGQC